MESNQQSDQEPDQEPGQKPPLRYLRIETTNTSGNDFVKNLAKVVITVNEEDLPAAVVRVTRAFDGWGMKA